jgi:RHH-type proline utilization regulon transcriptional repressor/proline dehydrogenase/delta 1-pyrroline-5-carboxylate dehydrogenase
MTLADRAVELAEALLREARAQQTSDERAQARKLARMLADPHGKDLTIALADQAFRSHRPSASLISSRTYSSATACRSTWTGGSAWLLLGGAMAHYLPSLVVPPIVARLRHETQNVILPGEEEDLRRYLESGAARACG